MVTKPSPESPNATGSELHELDRVIKNLNLRTDKLESNAVLSIWLIIGSIVVGFGVFVLAGTIAANDQVSYYREAKAIQFELAQNRVDISKVLDRERDSHGAPNISAQLTKMESRIEGLQSSLVRLESSLPDSLKDSEGANQRLLISSVTTRIAAASLLAFLVASLISLYRYNVRLAAFYRARIDALMLAGHLGPAVIEKLAKLLHPDKLDIDKMPESPTKQVVELLKQVTAASSRRTAK